VRRYMHLGVLGFVLYMLGLLAICGACGLVVKLLAASA